MKNHLLLITNEIVSPFLGILMQGMSFFNT